ncbi:AraC family transcriptional regulator [Erwinia pyrifoliae]|nr:AraC family transcriptional regulator [Erwinia pyrifoliae]MCA8877862.1 helix-turn-helix transcriptional regulator [Erwinia pyrifoliae]
MFLPLALSASSASSALSRVSASSVLKPSSRNSGSAQQNIVDLARVQVHQSLLQGEPLLEEVADNMGLSSWSLQRRLREEGLSFTTLADNVRCEMAKHDLQQHQLPISEMALLLGYSEVSAFSRAFRRWFGISPRQWRQEERGG